MRAALYLFALTLSVMPSLAAPVDFRAGAIVARDQHNNNGNKAANTNGNNNNGGNAAGDKNKSGNGGGSQTITAQSFTTTQVVQL